MNNYENRYSDIEATAVMLHRQLLVKSLLPMSLSSPDIANIYICYSRNYSLRWCIMFNCDYKYLQKFFFPTF